MKRSLLVEEHGDSQPRKRACSALTNSSSINNSREDCEDDDQKHNDNLTNGSRKRDDGHHHATSKELTTIIPAKNPSSTPRTANSIPSVVPLEGFVRVKTSYDYYEDISFGGPNDNFNQDSLLFNFVKSVPGHLKYDKKEYERVFMISWIGNILCFQVKDMKATKVGTLYRRANFSPWEILQIDCVIVKLPRFRLAAQPNDCATYQFRGIEDDGGNDGYITE